MARLLQYKITNTLKGDVSMVNAVYALKRHWKEIELWKDVTEEQWNYWVWQLTNTIKTID